MKATKTAEMNGSGIYPSTSRPSKLALVLANLYSLGHLRDGWHNRQGSQISPIAISGARELILQGDRCGVERLDTFPGKDGEVSVIFYLGEAEHSFQIEHDLSVWYREETSESESELLSLVDARLKVRDISLHENLPGTSSNP